MAVPRNRMSNARKNSKRAHHAKSPKHCIPCTQCGNARQSHRICSSCGYYGTRAIFRTEEKE